MGYEQPQKQYFDELRYTTGDITVDTAGAWGALTGEIGGAGAGDLDLQVAASAADVLLIGVHALWGTYSHASEFRTGRIDFASIVAGSPVNYLGARSSSTILGGMVGFAGGLAQMAAASVESDVVAPTAGTGGLYPYPVQAGDIAGGSVSLRPYVRVESSGRTLFASSSNPLVFWVLNLGRLTAS